MNLYTKTAMITGASTGIGSVYADRLAKRGYDLVLVARNQGRLEELAARLRRETERSIEVICADLNDPKDLSRVETVLRTDPSISMLVNNAGTGSATPLLEANVDVMDQMIRLNVLALTRLTYAAVPGFVDRGAGTIINVASIVAISPETLNGVYGGSKAFVLAFTQSLLHELSGKGIRVQAVLPGAVSTEFWDVAGLPVSNLPGEIVMTPQDLVDAALAGFDLGETITIPPLEDSAEWDAYESARLAMAGKLSNKKPASRYA